MSATFTGPSHATTHLDKVRSTDQGAGDRMSVILGVAVGLMVWATIAAMAVFALGRL